ncbi:hypothetical protein PG999_004985 [Apiospora kogelbergensis]|uniref:Glucose-methanol-choline oxidoreductase N-terminal domain-containing protein n=1 Tax=Apiospora kogelbergensis TaxID=1337665 RepID=A0AAW0R0R6_9PEZI
MATYDFIVVGSGPAGSALASSLSRTSAKPSVLLLEAGGKNSDPNLRVDGKRWLTFTNEEMNWGFKTAPQEHCDGRSIDYSGGRGLGGSSAINFGVYTIGARDDYDEWARIAGNDTAFGWTAMQERLKRLENFNQKLPAHVAERFAKPDMANHGTDGSLKVGFAAEWEDDVVPMLEVFEKGGFPLNPDHNSGNPIGMSALISSARNGKRSTAQDLYADKPENLIIITCAKVRKLVLEGLKVVGVETKDTKYLASKEVILSAGSLNSPSILMHSGIGPKSQLEQHQIPVVLDVPAVGQGLRDHNFCPLVYSRSESSTARKAFYGDQKSMDAALEQWKQDGTGPWSKFACQAGIGFFKLPALPDHPSFQALPVTEQALLQKPTIPHYEVFTHFPMHWFLPGFPAEKLSYSCLLVFLYNAQARGEVTLQSADPEVPLLFDPRVLSEEFDRTSAVMALRDVLDKIIKSEDYQKDTVDALAVPAGDSDEDLLAYWKKTISSSWHMTGTLKMGPGGGAPDTVVDPEFRVVGIEGLRVADMSVAPVLISGHIQAAAYATGLTCAEKVAKQYGLDA